MRLSTAFILIILLNLQGSLWFGKGSIPRVMALQADLDAQRHRNAQSQIQNEQIKAEVRDLKEGLDMAEEIARSELDMLKPGEIFVRLTP